MFWKRKTDEEFVEDMRKWLGRSKWLGLLHVASGVLLFCAVACFWELFINMFEIQAPLFGSGFISGVFLGLIFCTISFQAAFHFIHGLMYICKPRMWKLLVEYHDRLKKQAGVRKGV